MKILLYIWKNFVPRFIQYIIKYVLYWKKYTFAQVKPLHIFTLASKNTYLDPTVWIDPGAIITGDIVMGRYSYIRSPSVKIIASYKYKVSIGNFCSIASWVQIYSFNDHNYKKLTTYPPVATWIILWDDIDLWADVNIWHDVWIGTNAIILPWVNIGTGAVIWAWSIVTKNIPPYAIVWWVPAKVIKYRFDEDIIKKLLLSEWWNWDIEKIRANYNLEFIKN